MEEDIKVIEKYMDKIEQAIVNLIKENAKLEKEIDNCKFEAKYVEDNYIEKSKVREKIEELKELDKKEFVKQGNFDVEIGVLQELLQEGDINETKM